MGISMAVAAENPDDQHAQFPCLLIGHKLKGQFCDITILL